MGAPAGPQRVCVVGGGASGVGLIWCLARARQLGLTDDQWQITLLHEGSTVGGHSTSYPVPMNGQTVHLDLGVQLIAPAMYPAVGSMLSLPDFATVATDPVSLRVACAFPPVNGVTPYWGNFAPYQQTPLYQSGAADCATFEHLLEAQHIAQNDPFGWVLSLQDVLLAHRKDFHDLDRFEQYFLDPYMSIMNGYGAALLQQVLLADIAPLFDLKLASLTEQTAGFARFRDGADAWVARMAELAQVHFGPALDVRCNASVTALTSRDATGFPSVTWTEGGVSQTQPFDMVISTVDMWTLATLLGNDARWPFYKEFVGTQTTYGTSVWDLQPGYCYLHQDPSVLAPLGGTETLQFTAPAVSATPGGYDLAKTYTTYIESNLLGIALANPAEECYLTMYGFDPATVPGLPVPDPAKVLTSMQWEHGMWLPSFMVKPKLAFHIAQGISPHVAARDGQQDTGLWFAGNNLTMDSEEGAFVSAMALVSYLFDIKAPLLVASGDLKKDALMLGEYELLRGMMFPPLIVDLTQRVVEGATSVLKFLGSLIP
jgi:hypothetical protein